MPATAGKAAALSINIPAAGDEKPHLSSSTPVAYAGPTGDDAETKLDTSTPPKPSAPQPAEGIHLPKGYKLNNYEIIDKLGQGGFGITYRAREVPSIEMLSSRKTCPNNSPGETRRPTKSSLGVLTNKKKHLLLTKSR